LILFNQHQPSFCSLPKRVILFRAELKRSLYALCSQYGRILDVVALKTQKLRGQAWVVFSEITAATNAFRGLQDFDFYGKKMVMHPYIISVYCKTLICTWSFGLDV
jgi:hypothetical protein